MEPVVAVQAAVARAIAVAAIAVVFLGEDRHQVVPPVVSGVEESNDEIGYG